MVDMNNSNIPQTGFAKYPWEKYLPSKKIQIILLILVVGLLVYSLRTPIMGLLQKTKNQALAPIATLPKPQTTNSQTGLSIEKDSDGDGLMDWQETLIGTDPFTTNTTEEVPEDVREAVNVLSTNLADTEDKLALAVYQRLQTDPMGTNIQEAVQAATAKEILDYADSIDKQLTTYTYADLQLGDDTPETRASYRATITPLVADTGTDIVKNVYDSLFTGKTNITTAAYKINLAEKTSKMLGTPVPLRFANTHLSITNAMAHMSEALGRGGDVNDQSSIFALFLVYQKNFNVMINGREALFKMLTVSNS